MAGELRELFCVAGGARGVHDLSLRDALQLAASGYSLAAELGLRPAPNAPIAAASAVAQLAGGGGGGGAAAERALAAAALASFLSLLEFGGGGGGDAPGGAPCSAAGMLAAS